MKAHIWAHIKHSQLAGKHKLDELHAVFNLWLATIRNHVIRHFQLKLMSAAKEYSDPSWWAMNLGGIVNSSFPTQREAYAAVVPVMCV